MRGNLRGVLTRVNRLSQGAQQSVCDGNHTRLRVSVVEGDEPVPPWPDRDAPETCECGEPLKYRRVIHELWP